MGTCCPEVAHWEGEGEARKFGAGNGVAPVAAVCRDVGRRHFRRVSSDFPTGQVFCNPL